MSHYPVIGVIGGMGPQAGLDLMQKILDETIADRDQDHVPVALLSYPNRIPDRSAYLLGEGDSPVPALTDLAKRLARFGASVIGIPCNTAHAGPIFDEVVAGLESEAAPPKILHIIRETVASVKHDRPALRRIGVLSTYATYRLRLYADEIEAAGLEAVLPDEAVQKELINETIFQPPHGIKAQCHPISPVAREALMTAIEHLRERGAEAVILGCTELPLAVTERSINGLDIIDPTRALARALIRETYPDRLKDGTEQ